MELSPASCFSIQVLMRSRPSFLTCATALNSTVAKSVVSGSHATRSLADSKKCLSSDKKVGSKYLKFLAKTLRILICVDVGNAAFFCVIKWYSRCFRKKSLGTQFWLLKQKFVQRPERINSYNTKITKLSHFSNKSCRNI